MEIVVLICSSTFLVLALFHLRSEESKQRWEEIPAELRPMVKLWIGGAIAAVVLMGITISVFS